MPLAKSPCTDEMQGLFVCQVKCPTVVRSALSHLSVAGSLIAIITHYFLKVNYAI